MEYDTNTANYLKNLTGVGGLYALAAAAKAGTLDAYYAGIIRLYEAGKVARAITVGSEGGLIATGAAGAVAAGAIPVITMVGVWVALGSGYYQAREEAKVTETASGFSQGFVMALLTWPWSSAASLFGRHYLNINQADNQMNVIRVESYNKGLRTGFLAGVVLPPEAKKEYLRRIHQYVGYGPAHWASNPDLARNQKVSVVINLATTALVRGIIKTE